MNSQQEKKKPIDVTSLAAEGQDGYSEKDIFKRLDRYGKARENALQFSDYLAQENQSKLSSILAQCGNYIVFHHYFTVGQWRVSQFCTCKKHLLCPLCAIRRGGKALRVYLARFNLLIEQDPTLKPYMVTLTVRNGEDLSERFTHLSGALRAYHKRRSGKRQKGEILKAKSAVFTYEFTNKGNGWHPHVHAIWLCKEAPNSFSLSEEWHALTGDSYIVDVRPMNTFDIVSSFCEVFKYALKFSELENSDRLYAYNVLKGKRLQDSFGDFRGLDVEPNDSDDLLQDLPYIERIFNYYRGVGYKEMLSNDSGIVCNL